MPTGRALSSALRRVGRARAARRLPAERDRAHVVGHVAAVAEEIGDLPCEEFPMETTGTVPAPN